MPQQLSDATNVPLLACELFLSALALFAISMPLALLKAEGIVLLIVGFPTMGALIAIGWLPVWVLLLLSLLIGLFYADKIKGKM